MKINCAKCGKRFNAEEHMYICPKCNHYHSQTGKRSQMMEKQISSEPFKESNKNPLEKIKKKENEYEDVTIGSSLLDLIDDIIAPDNDANDAPEFIQTLNGEQKVYTAISKDKEKLKKDIGYPDLGTVLKKISKALTIILCIVIFISSAVPKIGEWIEGTESEDSSYIENEIVISDDAVVMEFDTFEVTAEKANELILDDMVARDGMKFLQVNYETIVYEEDEWLDTSVTVSDTDNSYNDYYPLYANEIKGLSGHEQKEIEKLGLNEYAHEEGAGFWLFEIPEDTESVYLNITTWIDDGSSDKWFVELNHGQTHTMRIDEL